MVGESMPRTSDAKEPPPQAKTEQSADSPGKSTPTADAPWQVASLPRPGQPRSTRPATGWEPIVAGVVLTIGLAIGCVVSLLYHPSVTYDTNGDVTVCISAWNRMTGHFYPSPSGPISPADRTYYALGGSACGHRISGLDTLAIVFLVGTIVSGAATIAFGLQWNRKRVQERVA